MERAFFFSYSCDNTDNGPESSGRRTQWLNRLVQLSDSEQLTIQLPYNPPYHSKYNPVERLWGVLENHWGGELLIGVDKALGLARTTYQKIKPTVNKVIRQYKTRKSLSRQMMKLIEVRLKRKLGLEN